MKRATAVVLVLVALCVGAGGMFAYTKLTSWRPWSRAAEPVHSGMPAEILVMRTRGGLLEVSTIHATEQFDKGFVYSVLGQELGRTVAHIRVPAVYRYHIELAPEWDVYRKGDVFKVVTPPVKPSLPVAVDLARLEKDEGGTWVLVPFNREDDLNALEREITAKLGQKAASPVYLQLQRETARRTVTEFVKKWLVTQEPWKTAQQPRIEVVFGE